MSHDDIHVEPIRGLPELPPEGERILWQGAPVPWSLARHAMNAHWIAAYFAALALWRGLAIGGREGLIAATWFIALGAVAVAVVALIAWVLARTTVYTLTTHRLAMRVGAALTITVNLPYRWIGSADLAVHRDGTGTITLDLKGDTRFSYLVLWPHVRPWAVRRTKPALRCIPAPREVAAILAQAAAARVHEAASGAPVRAPHSIAAE